MKKNITQLSSWIKLLVIGVLVLLITFARQISSVPETYFYSLGEVKEILTGASDHLGDLYGDYIITSQLAHHKNPYEPIGKVLKEWGIDWDVKHPHTHPPQIFYLFLPLIFLPFNVGFAIYGWIMLLLLYVSARCFGLQKLDAVLMMVVSLFWKPVLLSFSNTTIIWIFVFALFYKYRNTDTVKAAIAICLGMILKLLPAIWLAPMVLTKRFKAVFIAIGLFIITLLPLLLLYHNLLYDYVVANTSAKELLLGNPLNNSLVTYALARGGIRLVAIVLFFATVCLFSLKDVFSDMHENTISEYTALLVGWLSVACLPLSWPYSLAPLFVILMYFVIKGNYSQKIAGILLLLLPFLAYEWSGQFVIIGKIILIGSGLLLIMASQIFSVITHEIIMRYKSLEKNYSYSR